MLQRKRLRVFLERQCIKRCAPLFAMWRRHSKHRMLLRQVCIPAFAKWLMYCQHRLERRATYAMVRASGSVCSLCGHRAVMVRVMLNGFATMFRSAKGSMPTRCYGAALIIWLNQHALAAF